MNKKQVAVIWLGITFLILLFIANISDLPSTALDHDGAMLRLPMFGIPAISITGLLVYLFNDKKK